jgi:IS5 family transposase
VAVDAGSGLVRKAILTGAKTNESVVADDLICGDEQCLYGDKAYDSAARRKLLARLGIADGIMRRAWWGTARNPDPQLLARNRSLTRTRFAVERSFAWMKRWYGYRRVRYRGLVRNGLQLHLMCIALNLRRALTLGAA